MDIQLPVLDGYDAMRQIFKALPGFTTIPIIAVSSFAIKLSRGCSIASPGAVDFDPMGILGRSQQTTGAPGGQSPAEAKNAVSMNGLMLATARRPSTARGRDSPGGLTRVRPRKSAVVLAKAPATGAGQNRVLSSSCAKCRAS